MARHIRENDFARWGQMGGKETARNPLNWLRNLKQYQLKEHDGSEIMLDLVNAAPEFWI